MAAARRILFCAVGVRHSLGGIASASRNVSAGLQRLADETGRSLRTLVLAEDAPSTAAYRTFGGRKAAFAAASLANGLGADLVVFDHVHLAAPFLTVPRALRPKLVVFAHGVEVFEHIRPASIRSLAAADLVLTNSAFTLERMKRFVGPFEGRTCLLGLPPQFAVTTAPPGPAKQPMTLTACNGVEARLGDQVLLIVARLDAAEREKGHRELIDAMAPLRQAHPGAQLVMVGAGSDYGTLLAMGRASGAAESIFLPGRLSDADVQALYRKARAYVMPSRQEGFGLTYLEAMNYARPCLACRDDGGASIVVDGETGLLIDNNFSQGDLLAALRGLLDDPAAARAMGEAGWRRLMSQFTSAAHQDRVVENLRPLLV